MKLLADTHILLWLAEDSPKLSARAKEILLDPANEILFSTASIWEAAIKFPLKRSNITITPEAFRDGLLEYGFIEVPVRSDHTVAISNLPSTHSDPFDRLLVAQALVEGVPLLTADDTLATYPGTLLV